MGGTHPFGGRFGALELNSRDQGKLEADNKVVVVSLNLIETRSTSCGAAARTITRTQAAVIKFLSALTHVLNEVLPPPALRLSRRRISRPQSVIMMTLCMSAVHE
jgi:hypothetical protein